MSDDRKYRQRGYQDDDRDRRPQGPRPEGGGQRPEREPGAPAGARRISSEGARNPRMMGRSCIQCVNFDPGAPLECAIKLTVRVSPKDEANACPHFGIRATIERETTAAVSEKSSNPKEPSGAKKAFDDLFKF
jgi:hypothetical protein